MKSLGALYTKELRSYFNSPMAWGLILFFQIFTASWFLFFNQFLLSNQASLRGFFGPFPLLFTVLAPAVTMRLWAEERKMGTAELLLTLPLKPSVLVVGKWLAAWTVLAFMLASTLPLVLSVLPLGSFEPGEWLGAYLGSLFLAGAASAIGLFFSALAANQISAFLLGSVVLLVMTLAGFVGTVLELPEPLAQVFRLISLEQRFNGFQKGLLDTRDLSYFLLAIGIFLYANTKILIFRRWK